MQKLRKEPRGLLEGYYWIRDEEYGVCIAYYKPWRNNADCSGVWTFLDAEGEFCDTVELEVLSRRLQEP